MFHQKYPGKAFVSRLIFLHVQFNKRLVTMSLRTLSEESSEPPPGRGRGQISADSTGAVFGGGVTGDVGGDNEPAGRKFTEEEVTIHRLHREACEVKMNHLQVRNFRDHLPDVINAGLASPRVYVGRHFVFSYRTAAVPKVF